MDENQKQKSKLATFAKMAAFIAFVAIAIWFFRFTETGRQITPGLVRDKILAFGSLAFLAYIAFYAIGTVLLIPGTALSFAGAILFGAYWGTLYTWIGATIGATLSFLVAKKLGRPFVEQLLGNRFQALEDRMSSEGFRGLLLVRLLPLFPFIGVNFGCGLTSIRLQDYVLATAIGIIPGTFMYQLLFAKIGERILTEKFQWNYLLDPELIGVLIGFVLFIVILRFLAKRFARNSADRL